MAPLAKVAVCQWAVLDWSTRRATMDAAARPLVHGRPLAVPAVTLVVGRPAGPGSVCLADSCGTGDSATVGSGGRPHVVPAATLVVGRPALVKASA